ncbi:MAG TPA: signal peptidase II [Caulobacteraceae bacterium]|nr:signal peptidase II [Caulobacteraceae bacterium]
MRASVTRPGSVAYLLAAVVVAADQATKFWLGSVYHLGERGVAPLLGPIRLHLIWNQGVSFGFFQDYASWTRWALASFSLAVAIGLAFWARHAKRTLLGIAAGLLMGGALGNLIDRLRDGAVMDFIDATRLHFPWVFNIADSAITVGVILLLLDSAVAPGEDRR